MKGRIAYVEQESFILSDTFLENILFGNPQDQARLFVYKIVQPRLEKVIKMCALEEDLKMLSDGIMTMLGERGTTLSGG